jgi:hypothetical protein
MPTIEQEVLGDFLRDVRAAANLPTTVRRAGRDRTA